MRLRLAPSAAQNIDDIFDYWSDRASVDVAERLTDGVKSRFGLLSAFPDAGRKREEMASCVRCFPAGRFLTYYRKTRRFVEILHVFDGARVQAEVLKKSR